MEKEPRTIAIVAGQLVVGGAERQLTFWLEGMDRARFRPVVVTLHPFEGDYWEPWVESRGIPLLRVRRRRNRAARVLEIVKCLRPYRPRLVHGWHLFTGPYAGLASRLLGADACLGSLRGSYESFESSPLQARLTLALVDGLLVNSQSAGDRVALARPSMRGKVFVVPNAVEDRFRARDEARGEIAARFGLPGDAIWIGTMGRLERAKRFDMLLEMMASLVRRGMRARLLLIGDGPAGSWLRMRAGELALQDAVVFTGADPSARTWLNALDIFCFPSMDEGLPNVVMEAAAAGLPVVSWRTPFLEELLAADRSAVLLEPGDARAMEEAVVALASDPGRRRELGSRARTDILGRYSIGKFIERMTGAYTALLDGPLRAGRGAGA